MALFDLPIDELRTYRPDVAEPDDFDTFWDETLAEAAQFPLNVRSEKIDNRLSLVDSYDLTFAGFSGSDVRAWLHVPAGASGPLPAVVHFRGYSGGRGMPFDNVYAQAGYAHLVLDTRGQGWASRSLFDTTPDEHADAGLASAPGHMTKGVLNPLTYYYRRLFVDCVRLLQVAAAHPLVDATKIVVTGASQGGGMSIAAAALGPRVGVSLAGCAPDVPFLCHMRRGVEIGGREPYAEVERYLAAYPQHTDQAFWTLSHFDGVNFAKRIACPALFSVALMDQICPPSTVFAAYNSVSAVKDITVYPFNGHDGGDELQLWTRLGWLRELFD